VQLPLTSLSKEEEICEWIKNGSRVRGILSKEFFIEEKNKKRRGKSFAGIVLRPARDVSDRWTCSYFYIMRINPTKIPTNLMSFIDLFAALLFLSPIEMELEWTELTLWTRKGVLLWSKCEESFGIRFWARSNEDLLALSYDPTKKKTKKGKNSGTILRVVTPFFSEQNSRPAPGRRVWDWAIRQLLVPRVESILSCSLKKALTQSKLIEKSLWRKKKELLDPRAEREWIPHIRVKTRLGRGFWTESVQWQKSE